MIWGAAGVIVAAIAAHGTLLNLRISDLKADINRQFDAISARIDKLEARIARLEDHLFKTPQP